MFTLPYGMQNPPYSAAYGIPLFAISSLNSFSEASSEKSPHGYEDIAKNPSE